MIDRSQLQNLCDEYVLGLLEGEELQQLEQLFQSNDAEALEALHHAEEAALELAIAAPSVTPPEELRARLEARIATETQPRQRNAITPFPATAPGSVPTATGRLPVWAGWAVAAGLGIGIVYVNQQASRNTENLQAALGEAQAEVADLEMTVQQQQQVLNIIGAQDAQVIRLVNTDQPQQFAAYWSDANGLVLVGTNIPAPAPGRAMQLWVVPDGADPVSAGVFNPEADGSVLLFAQNVPGIATAAALAISDETAGGSPQPTTTPAWVGPLGG